MITRRSRLAPLLAAFALLVMPALGRAQSSPATDQLAGLLTHVDSAMQLIAGGDVAGAQAEYQLFEEGWSGVADGVQAQSPTSAQSIADAMADVRSAFGAESVDPVGAQTALLALRDQANFAMARGRPGAQTLTLYSAQHDYVTNAVVDAFQKQTGIAVRVHAGDDFELANQLVAEGSASPADVFLTENSPPLMLLSERGLLANSSAQTLSRVPSRFNSPNGDWVGVAARETVLVYNPRVIGDAQLPRSLLELAQPAWKGKLAIAPAEPDFQPVVSAVIKVNGQAAAESWLSGFKDNATLYNDNEGIVSAVERGQVGAGIVNHYYWFKAAADTGGPDSMQSRLAYFTAGDPGALLDVSGAGQLQSAPHPEQAQSFLDFLVSQRGQAARVAAGDFEYPLGIGAIGSSVVKPFDQLQPPNISPGDLGDGQDALQLLQKVGLI